MTCVFCHIEPDRIIKESNHFFVIRDIYPVSEGHTLIISKEHRTDFFELSDEEKAGLTSTISEVKQDLENDFSPDGYNIGMNCGAPAGQTVFHFHCHVIPRYSGDMDDPRGGVRHSVEGKGYY